MRQAQALTVLMDGESVFLTGAPGAGKTYVLNQFILRSRRMGKDVAVTASTGIAATHISGSTIHSWSGLGIRDELLARDRQQIAANPKLVKRYNSCDVLVIDEVSMLHGARLDMVNEVCKLLRKSEEPFGGMQVVLVGDLFQLPPVSRDSDIVDFAHLSPAWQELSPQICYLNEQHRQTGDGLLTLLEAMRSGEIEDYHEALLQERIGQKPKKLNQVTRLYAHNVDIDSVNSRHLSELQSSVHIYDMVTSGATIKVDQLSRSVLAPQQLELKKGAQVMFVANNLSAGFVNGTRGRVLNFKQGKPIIELTNGRKIAVSLHSWKLEEDGKVKAEVSQLPLRLAWAITIHKSQGMSLDAAEIDLSKSFTPGMGYVALSRVRSLDGLYLAGINQMALKMHPQIFEFDKQLRLSSSELASSVSDFVEPNNHSSQSDESIVNAKLLADLKNWRLKRAKSDSVPAYIIAHDSVLELIATKLPSSSQALNGIKGLGGRKIEQYGEDILQLVAKHTGKTIPKPKAKGRKWLPEDDELLATLVKQQQPLERVCSKLERDPEEVWLRLQQILTEG